VAEVQLSHAPESSLHWKLEPLSVAVNAKLALVEVVVPDGPELIAVSGALVTAGGCEDDTVQARGAGDASVLPAASVAFTEKV
jgi:hypothetical protein